MDLLFLLGSGISLDSGLPCTACLTRFLFDKNSQQINNNFTEVKIFLKQIKTDFEIYVKKYSLERAYEMNYEDLYFVLEALIPNDEKYYKDYNIAYFKKCLQVKHGYDEVKYKLLIKKAKLYISDVVRSSLSHDSKITGLNLLNELKNNPDTEKVHLFTLNHDLLIENFLSNELIDGFKQNGELRYFDPREYKRNDKKFYLYKLHGSIDWFYCSNSNSGKREPIKLSIWNKTQVTKRKLKDSEGNTWQIEEDIPRFLTGGNKTFRYYYQDYFELHCKFFECLKNHQTLIISGYGGYDNLINFRINDWLESKKENQCVFLHEKNIPEYFIDKPGCKIISKWLKDTTLKDIKEFLT